MRAYETAIEQQRGNFPDAHRNLGNALARLGNLDRAADSLKQAIAQGDTAADAHHDLGLILYGRGQLDDAISEFRTALEMREGTTPKRIAISAACFMKAARLKMPAKSLRRPSPNAKATAARCAMLHEKWMRRQRKIGKETAELTTEDMTGAKTQVPSADCTASTRTPIHNRAVRGAEGEVAATMKRHARTERYRLPQHSPFPEAHLDLGPCAL